MSTVVKDLGAVSAYAYAVEKGYTGTEAEFAELMADYAEVGQRAEDAADSALESKTAAQTAATTATNKASEATTAATTATNKAAEAQADADAAALDASQALSAASTATTKATEATTAAATAVTAKDDAVSANTAAQSAKTAAQTAQTGAETAAASVQSSAEQIATNTEDITQLKSEISEISESSPNIWDLDDADVTISVYKQYGDAGTELLPAGTYTFSANITSDNTICAVIAYTASQSLGGDIACNTGSRQSKTFTANAPIERLFIYAGSNYAGASGHTATFSDIQLELGSSATSYEEPFTTAVDKVARVDVASRDDYMGVEKPNLLNNTLSYRSDSGVTFTVNDDKTITVNGTASATARTDAMTVTLPKGKYLLTGCPEDASNYTYYYFIIRGNGSYTSQSKDYVLDVTDETETIQIYVRVDSGKTADHKVFKPMVLDYYSQYRGYVPYGEIQEYLPLRGLINYTEFNWSGKKANFIGDSIIEGVYNIGSFVDITSRILNLETVRNYGVGGCRMASTDQDASYPPVVNRYANMDNDADIVWVHAGTNDWASQVPLGANDSTDITTFNGALNTIMSGLRSKYPTALIVFSNILPRQDYDAPSHGGHPMTILTSQYSEAIKTRCADHHIVMYDAYSHCGFDFEYDFENNIFATTNDGLHPNSNGIKILGRKVAGFINWN